MIHVDFCATHLPALVEVDEIRELVLSEPSVPSFSFLVCAEGRLDGL